MKFSASLRAHQNKTFLLPIPRRTTDASAKNVSMVSGFYGAPKRRMQQDLTGVSRGRVPLWRECERKEEKERKRVEGCRMPGQRASKQDNNRKPTVPWFIPNHTPRPGPARPSPPLLSTPPTLTPPCHVSQFHPSLKQITHIIF